MFFGVAFFGVAFLGVVAFSLVTAGETNGEPLMLPFDDPAFGVFLEEFPAVDPYLGVDL